MALDRIVDRPRRSLKRLKPSFIALADRARATGQWERAAQLYRKALHRNPRNAPIWIQYGHALKEAGKLCEPDKLAHAELAYREALSLDPSVADSYVQLGHVLKLQGKTNEAEASYLRAFALDPSIPYPLRELSGLGWSEAQMAGLRGLVGPSLTPPATPTAHATFREEVCAEPKGSRRGTGPRRGLIRRKPGAVALADRARNAGEWGRAAQLYRKALDRNPRNPSIWVQYGHALKESGELRDPEKLAEAEIAYRQALSLDPNLADTYVQLGHILKLQGETDGAEACYLRAFALDPSTPYPVNELSGLGWSEAQLAELKKLFGLEGSTAPHSDPSDHPIEVIRHDPDAFEIALAEARRRADKVLAALPQTQRREAARGPIVRDTSEGRLLLADRRLVDVPDLFELRALKPHGRIAVVLHLFDSDLWPEMREAIERICHPFDLFVSLTKGSSDHMRDVIKERFPDALIFDFEDHGRDIGPFIVFLQSGVLFRYELVCKLHTKRSPHLQNGDAWRRALIDGLLGSSRLINQIIARFHADPDLGMVVADGNIYRGPEHWAGTEQLLAELLPRIGISPDIQDRSFPGGSIFWIRSFLLRTLAGAGISLQDFDPEPLQQDGGLGHAVERMFGLICEDAGMRVIETGQVASTFQQPSDGSSKVHIIALYLPQFHPIPENDEWWGAGFTEWTNVTTARALFANHRQPRLPSDLGFYDLRLAEVREKQAELARAHGLAAFCYYYYWFNGRRVLERPLDEVLATGRPDFPFLIVWANEPWSRNWDGLNQDVLLSQTYEPGWATWLARDVAPLLRDCRYFRLGGKPMVLIYRIGHVPDAAAAMRQLRNALSLEGIAEVHLAAAWVTFPGDVELPADPSALGLDAYFEFPPHHTFRQLPQPFPSGVPEELGGLYDYNYTLTAALSHLNDPLEGRRHRGVMAGWDNTARRGSRAFVFHGATPTNFRRWLRGTVLHERRQGGERVIVVNAWNEWAEGTYLEPDRDFGCGWLEAVASAVDDGRSKTWALDVPSETGDDEGHRPVPLNLERQAPVVSNRDPDYSWAKALSDDEWCAFLAGTAMGGRIPPPLPPEAFQWAWVGNSGDGAFREAMAFCRLLKSTLEAAGYKLDADSRLLDIGVGWGRIYRVLLRETPHIVGIDVVRQCVELCRSAFPDGKFEIAPPAPPYRFTDGEFDVAYLYSVFTHLSEGLFLATLRELARVVRKGGFVVFTTVRPSDDVMRQYGFSETWRADAAAGQFLWLPTGGGHENMPSSVWGWAHVSEPYLRRNISNFPFELVSYEPDRLIQAFAVLKKQ